CARRAAAAALSSAHGGVGARGHLIARVPRRHSALRRTMNVASARDTTAPWASATVDSTYATWRVSCTTSPRTLSASPTLGARRVWYDTSSVATRSPDSSAALAAKFIAASCTTPYTPPCTMPNGLPARSVGVQAASAHPSP